MKRKHVAFTVAVSAISAAAASSSSSSSSPPSSFSVNAASQIPVISLARCDPTDSAQNWTLNVQGWGANNTVQNAQLFAETKSRRERGGSLGLTLPAEGSPAVACLDVLDWAVGTPGTPVTAHECCGLAGEPEDACKFPDKNYNEQWTFSPALKSGDADPLLDAGGASAFAAPTTGKVRVMRVGRHPGLCLDAGTAEPGSPVTIADCDSSRDAEQTWTVSGNGLAPLLSMPAAAPSPAAGSALCLTAAAPAPSPAPAPATPTSYRGCVLPNTTSLPFCDPELPTAARAKDLVSRMTLEEKKVQLIGGIGGGITPATPRLGVPAYQYHSEGLHGLRDSCKQQSERPLYSTMFPQVTAMAATFNMTLVAAMAGHMADEARAVNNVLNGKPNGDKGGGLNYWGPTMNIGRDPRWGRFQESVSEDPFLNGAYSSHFVTAFQGTNDGVSNFTKAAACCKHFYAYSLEGADGFTRHTFDANVTKRDLAETYLPAFHACVAAAPEQVMCSYNEVNGVPTCLDDSAQNGWLRSTLSYGGLIVSDCDAVGDAYSSHHYSDNASQAAAQGIRAGCDLDCGSTYKAENLQAALDAGLMTEDDLDLALERTLRMRFNLGLFNKAEDVPYTQIGADVLNNEYGQELALTAARESIVLLQNNASTLPLAVGTDVKEVLIVGPIAQNTQVMMGGKNDYCPEHTVSLLEGLQALANSSANVAASSGAAWRVVYNDGSNMASAVKAAKEADFVIITRGGVQGHEGADRSVLTLDDQSMDAVTDAVCEAVSATKLALVVVVGEPVALDMYTDKFGAIVLALEGGQAAGTAFADVIVGNTNPSGALPFTMYAENYVNEVKMSDMSLRPNAATGSKGKTYRFYTGSVVWPFGHGLSYTSFSIDWGSASSLPPATVPAPTLLAGDISIPVVVSNTGRTAGSVAVQLYISTPVIQDSPLRSLIAFDKVFLAAGQSTTITFRGDSIKGMCPFCVYDTTSGSGSVPVGTHYQLSVGNGASSMVVPINITAS